MARARQNGEGSIYQRKSDGLWIGSVTLGWEGPKRLRKTVSAKTADEARAKLRAVERKIEDGLPVNDGKFTVNQLLDRWLNEVMRHQVASPALSNYEIIAKHHIRPKLGKKLVAKLKPDEIDALLSAKLTGDKAADIKPLSVSTVRRIRSVLAQALTQAQRWEWVGRNAATLSRPPRESRREGRSMSPEDAAKFMAAIKGDRLEALFLTMLGTGLRRGEALALKWSDVNLDKAVLTVRSQLRREIGPVNAETGKRERAGLTLVETKTDKSRRQVDLPKFVVDALKAHQKRQKVERVKLGAAWRNSGYVFTSTIGTAIDPRNASKAFSVAAEDAGIGAWHIHELRHSAASLMLAHGVPIEVVSAILGHASIRITVDTYTHIAASQRKDGAMAMDAALGAL